MIYIQYKFRCNLPVIMMSETGIGKSSLINFLVNKILGNNLITLNVNSDTSIQDVLNFLGVGKWTSTTEKWCGTKKGGKVNVKGMTVLWAEGTSAIFIWLLRNKNTKQNINNIIQFIKNVTSFSLQVGFAFPRLVKPTNYFSFY